ncbi:hypothetical protein ABIC84_001375 [Mucilaginibacter sp. 3215]
MVRLVIDIPKTKSILVKQILRGLGVTIQQEIKSPPSVYRKKLSQVSTWTEEDLKAFDEGKNALKTSLRNNFNCFTPPTLRRPCSFLNIIPHFIRYHFKSAKLAGTLQPFPSIDSNYLTIDIAREIRH